MLARRLELLREVGRLQESLDVPGDVSYTCETAGHFYLYQVRQELAISYVLKLCRKKNTMRQTGFHLLVGFLLLLFFTQLVDEEKMTDVTNKNSYSYFNVSDFLNSRCFFF